MPKVADYVLFCPIARSLDVLGDRWTLLIMRDLVNGERRFTDLRTSLVGIPPNLLSQRLKVLIDEGLVETRELPPPAARTVYAATDAGMETVPILRALVRFGVPRLGHADEEVGMAPRQVVHATLAAFYEADPSAPSERYDIVVDDVRFTLGSTSPKLVREPTGTASVTVDAPRWVLLNIRTGAASWDDAIATGALTVTGTKRSIARFRSIYQLL